MGKVRTLVAIFCACVGFLVFCASASAQPGIPATFFGSVTVDGEPAPAGTEVRGLIGGLDCTQAPPGQRPVFRDGEIAAYVIYVVHDSQRAGCASDGSRITFTIGGRPAVQTAVWKAGPNRLDISTGNQSPIPLPSAIGTFAVETVTAGAGTLTPPDAGTAGRPTGTPPTDDVQIPRGEATPRPPGDLSGGDDDSGFPVLPVLVGGLLLLGGSAGAAGYWLSRRQRPAG